MLNALDYYLPDIELLENKSSRFLIWIPDKMYIVLGASNKADDAIFVDKAKEDNITVLKRPSGGQTVMLTPNNIVIACVFDNEITLQPKDVFNQMNTFIISVLKSQGVVDLQMNGISDVSILDKKILGSSIYRSKDVLLYHAVLNLGEPASTFEKYLKYPSKEPDYRNGRKHSDFVTSIKENGYQINPTFLKNEIGQQLNILLTKSQN